MARLKGDDAVAFRVLAILPECTVEARRQDHQHVRIGKPVLLAHNIHHEVTVHLAVRGHRLQHMGIAAIVVQARRQPFDVLHHQIGLDGMQPATGGHVLLHEHQVLADTVFSGTAEGPLQHPRQHRQRQRSLPVEVATGCATGQQRVEGCRLGPGQRNGAFAAT